MKVPRAAVGMPGRYVVSIHRTLSRWVTLIASLGIAAPAFAATSGPASGTPVGDSPRGLQPTQVNVTNDPTLRYGEPEVVANPRNPNNLVYFVMSNQLTYQCEAAGNPLCTTLFFGLALGQFVVPGWTVDRLFVSFDRGRTWENVAFPLIPQFRGFPGEATDHSGLLTGADPMVTATADGTFYIAWDSEHEGESITTTYGGIAISKSTDGGRTWSTPVLTGTPVDRPWLTADLSTGTIYEASGSPPATGFLGSFSTGNPSLPFNAPPGDRWLVASHDGFNWTTPQRLGGGGVPGFAGAESNTISAAHGVLAATFRATDNPSCQFFVAAPAPCTVFQTTRDAGASWSRHLVPVPSNSTGSVLVAANPVALGTYSLAVLNSAGTEFLVSVTHDSGATWSQAPTVVTDNPNTTKFKSWMSYSPRGVLGLAWRSASGGGTYTVFAAISLDEGATFSDPLQISTAASPAPDPNMPFGTDDTSFINLGDCHAFVGWGDWRPGDVSGYFSAVKLHAFSVSDEDRRGGKLSRCDEDQHPSPAHQ